VEHGTDEGTDTNYKANQEDGQCLTGQWFTKQLSNGNFAVWV